VFGVTADDEAQAKAGATDLAMRLLAEGLLRKYRGQVEADDVIRRVLRRSLSKGCPDPVVVVVDERDPAGRRVAAILEWALTSDGVTEPTKAQVDEALARVDAHASGVAEGAVALRAAAVPGALLTTILAVVTKNAERVLRKINAPRSGRAPRFVQDTPTGGKHVVFRCPDLKLANRSLGYTADGPEALSIRVRKTSTCWGRAAGRRPRRRASSASTTPTRACSCPPSPRLRPCACSSPSANSR
jgi:hypothetical protein